MVPVSADLSSSLFRRGDGNGVRYIICIRVDFVAVCVLGLRMILLVAVCVLG